MCDLILVNWPNYHIWYFKKYQFQILKPLWFFKPDVASHRPVHAWFLKNDLIHAVCVCVCVSLPPRLVITNGMMRRDMNPIWVVKQVLQLCMAAIVGIISRHGLNIEAHHRKQPNISKLSLYKPLLHFYNHLKQLYLSNKIKHFSYKGVCGIRGWTHIKTFKTRAGLGYRYVNGFGLLVIKQLCH